MVSVHIDLYCEDRGHEQLMRALMKRLSRDVGLVDVTPRTIVARGGHGKAIGEFRAWQRSLSKGVSGIPDLLVLVIDGNCKGWAEARRELDHEVDEALIARHVIGCPDPHVERWCMADPSSFAEVIGRPPGPDPGKCERSAYKDLLRQSIRDAGQPILTDEMEYAEELILAMNLYQAGKRCPDFGAFCRELRQALTDIARPG